jgi:hypothetical protein
MTPRVLKKQKKNCQAQGIWLSESDKNELFDRVFRVSPHIFCDYIPRRLQMAFVIMLPAIKVSLEKLLVS